MRTLKALLPLILLVPATGWAQTDAASKPSRNRRTTVSEKLICHLDLSIVAEPPVSSPDSRRVAYVTHVGGKMAVVLDGKKGRSYPGIGLGSLVFSPDSRRTAY